jgi:hypothetical protein
MAMLALSNALQMGDAACYYLHRQSLSKVQAGKVYVQRANLTFNGAEIVGAYNPGSTGEIYIKQTRFASAWAAMDVLSHESSHSLGTVSEASAQQDADVCSAYLP